MTLATQMTLALLQELLMALRANDADGYKSWLALGIEQLGRDVAAEVESDEMRLPRWWSFLSRLLSEVID